LRPREEEGWRGMLRRGRGLRGVVLRDEGVRASEMVREGRVEAVSEPRELLAWQKGMLDWAMLRAWLEELLAEPKELLAWTEERLGWVTLAGRDVVMDVEGVNSSSKEPVPSKDCSEMVGKEA